MTRTIRHAVITCLVIGTSSPAFSDDLASCCADLEARIAELEKTAVAKGNRKVSLMISGQINKAMTFWDDGVEQNAYVVDNDFAQSRVRFQGKAELAKGWELGYWLELGFDSASSDSVSQTDPDAGAPGATAGGLTGIELRPARWYIKSEDYGQLWVGRGSTAQDNLYKWANLGRAYSDAELHYNGRFALRRSDGVMGMSGTSATAVTRIWDDVANNLDLSRTSNVRYDTPTIAGFMLSATYNPGISDVALRYTENFGTFTVNWGIGYLVDSDTSGADRRTGLPIQPTARGNETKDVVGSAGFLEKDSGLYFYSAFGWRKIDDQGFAPPSALGIQDDNANYWYIQTGLSREIFSLGATNLHIDYGQYDNWLRGSSIAFGPSSLSVTGSKVTRWGLGVTQVVKAGELDLYAIFNHYALDLDTALANGTPVSTDMQDWMAVTTGLRVNF